MPDLFVCILLDNLFQLSSIIKFNYSPLFIFFPRKLISTRDIAVVVFQSVECLVAGVIV